MDDLKQQNAMYCDVLVKLLQANPKYSVRSGQRKHIRLRKLTHTD